MYKWASCLGTCTMYMYRKNVHVCAQMKKTTLYKRKIFFKLHLWIPSPILVTFLDDWTMHQYFG